MEISLDILIITIYVLMIIILYLPIDNLKKILINTNILFYNFLHFFSFFILTDFYYYYYYFYSLIFIYYYHFLTVN